MAKKIGFLLLLPVLVCLVSIILFSEFLQETRGDAHLMNVAGHQRKVVAELRSWARMVASGQDEDREGLRSRAAEFDATLAAMQRGGRVLGVEITPALPELRAVLGAVAGVWGVLKPDLDLVAVGPRDQPGYQQAYRRIEARIDDLQVRSHAVTVTFEARTERLRRRMLQALIALGGFVFLVFAVGLWLTRHYIVGPVTRLDEAARRIGGGDFSQRLDITTRDELATLAGTFNQMTAQVEQLLEALNSRRQHTETIIEGIPVGLLVLRSDLTTVRTNLSFREALGLDERTVNGRPLAELLPTDGLREAALEVIASGQARHALHFESPRKDGTRRSLRVTLAATHLAEEEAELLMVVEDLTEEEQLAARVRVSERRFQEVVETATDCVILVGKDGRMTYFNRSAEKLFGWGRQEVLGQPVTVLIPKKYHAQHEQGLAHYLERVERGIYEVLGTRQREALRKDGHVFPIEYSISVSHLDDEMVFTCILRDISEQKELAARMMEMDRMVAVGTLAAGVAHEINNPLAYVIANLELVASEFPEISAVARRAEASQGHQQADGLLNLRMGSRLADLQQALDEACEGAHRIRVIVDDIKVFSRAQEDRSEPVALSRVVESAISMAWNEIRHRARLVKDYAATPPVEANESRLCQVLLNLLINAAQAIGEGRTEENEIRIVTRTDEEGRAVVEVRDTGGGIPADVLPRIFDPFFTTKPVGQGTGLGLHICRNIVKDMGGEINIESQVGKGTVFCLVLPPAQRDVVETVSAPRTVASPGRRGRILIVDDEPHLCTLLRRVLAADHDIISVASGREALDKLASETFDLILCDLMMPEMTGMDLHERLSDWLPDQAARMIFVTGGAFTSRAREFLDRVPNQRLDKPFNVQHVRALVRNFLG